MSLGKRLYDLRKSVKLSQRELAEKVFVTDKAVSSWEKDRTEPSLEMIVKLSEVFNCSASYLIYGDVKRNDVETEIKIKLEEHEFKRLAFFMKNNAKFLNESKQFDTYYQPTYRKFIKDGEAIKEWLRIGQRGNKKILTYKNWYDVYCDEYEIEIDNTSNLDRILRILGLEEIAIVDKTRTLYCYLDKYEVALDYVESLGYFIEIEVKKYDGTVMEEYDKLLKVAKGLQLNLDNIDHYGYPYYLIDRKK